MTGVAQLMEVRVKVANDGPSQVRQMYRLTPPLEGEDGVMHEFGAAMETFGVADVFAATIDGSVMRDDDGLYVSLLNSPLLERRQWTIPALFERYGYQVTR